MKRAVVSKSIHLATGRAHRILVLPERQDVTLELVTSDKHPVPEADFVITFADGHERTGRLDRSGRATIENAPPGPYSVVYPDHADVRAKALAARVGHAVKESEPALAVAALVQGANDLPAVASAFDRYFASGATFVEALRKVTAGRPEEIVVEHLLSVARLDSAVVAVGWAEQEQRADAPGGDSKLA